MIIRFVFLSKKKLILRFETIIFFNVPNLQHLVIKIKNVITVKVRQFKKNIFSQIYCSEIKIIFNSISSFKKFSTSNSISGLELKSLDKELIKLEALVLSLFE